ncbi:MAG: hypothetical protein HUJ26_09420 [Planctomycetaceae bacterium]|nr:hypothetical protein [Planctomycetaceae bacterium]
MGQLMNSIYQALYEEDYDYGVARTIERKGPFYLPYTGFVEDWEPLVLRLTEGESCDYLSSNLGCRLCSGKLKNIFEDGAASTDKLQWLPVEVQSDAESLTYWILHFPDPPDVLDLEKSILAGDFVVKPVFAREKLYDHAVFSYPEAGELTFFVSEPVKCTIENASCTGLELSPAPVV